jgi:hypothetical protein
LLLLSFSPFVAGSAAIGAACQKFNTSLLSVDGAPTKYICAVRLWYGPSPAVANGQTVYIGNYQDDFDIIQLGSGVNAERLDESTLLTLPRTGEKIQVVRSPETRTCNVTISGMQCSRCAICASSDVTMNVISTDCSNIQRGRNVTCEPIEKVFYPINGYSRPSQLGTRPPTPAPVATCLARGSQCTASKQCCSGRCVSNKCRQRKQNRL